MKVLHVISDENIGGAGVLLCTLLRHFDRERVQSAVALPQGSALIPRIKALDVPILELGHPCDRFNASSVREVRTLLRRERVDLVHANAALCARVAGKQYGIPVLHTRHCCFPPSGIWRLAPMRQAGGFFNRRLSDRVIATADAAAENLRQYGIPQTRIEVIINGSEAVRQVSEEELARMRQTFGVSAEDFTVGMCARLEPCKGHATLLQAAKRVCERLPRLPFRFLLAGEGSIRRELEDRAVALGLRDRVRFLGFLQDTAPFYRLLRLNVNCSCGTETSCLAISEGFSAGVPVIASDYGGNRAMVGDGLAGILFPTGDVEALAQTICRIAQNPALEAQMRQAALHRYQAHYTPSLMTERLTQVYESML